MRINKRGATLTAWVFTIITILAFVLILQSQVLTPMNEIYNQSYETGLNTSALDSFDSMRGTSNTQIQGSEVEQSNDGLTLTSSWAIGKNIYNTLIDFISGSFIRDVFEMLDFPPEIANIVIILIWVSLIMIIIYLFMKVVP